ncbi:MAG: hypothetical protein IJ575_01860 [Selenomonadaceae bacterium]|nr:hypothetical protein [Selenomonadaceae bacterium]
MKRFAVLAVAGVAAFGFSGNVQAAEVDSDITIESGIDSENLSDWHKIRDGILGRDKHKYDRDRDRRPPPPPPRRPPPPPPPGYDRDRRPPPDYHRPPPPPPRYDRDRDRRPPPPPPPRRW